jgi:lysophospholipase L1-like esterase
VNHTLIARRTASALVFLLLGCASSSSSPPEPSTTATGSGGGAGAGGSAGSSAGNAGGSSGGGGTQGIPSGQGGALGGGGGSINTRDASLFETGSESEGGTTASDASATVTLDAAPEGSQAVDAGSPAVRFVGRIDRTNAAGPRFAWPGTTALARFTGSTIGVRMSGPPTYFDVSIDGVMQTAPLVLAAGKTDYPLATGLSAGPHELTVYRRSEAGIAGTGDTTFLGLLLDPAGALLPPSLPAARRIEIVGDSITTGYGDQSINGACPNQLAAQDYDVAYGADAARALGADLVTIAWTGKGMYRNSGGDMANTMSILYGRTLPDQTTDTWDFTSWIPDAVVIYLGNNDFGQGDPGQPYVTAYNTFLARVRSHYPNAFIVCTIGPNLADPKLSQERTYVQGIVSAATMAGDQNIEFLEMPQPTAAEGTGCGGHPLATTHKRMGDALVTVLKTKLGW